MILQRALASSLALLLFSQCCPDCLAVQYRESSASTHQKIAARHRHQGDRPSEAPEIDDLEARIMAADVRITQPLTLSSSDHVLPKLHVHIHKAGGTTMCWLAGLAGEVTPQHSNCNWAGNDVIVKDCFPEKLPSCKDRREAYESNKWTYGQIERAIYDTDLCSGFQYSVLLRDPIDLITSVINYEHGPNASTRIGHMRELIAKGLTKETVMGPWDTSKGLQPRLGWKFMDNLQVRVLAGAMQVPPGNVTVKHLQIAKDRLADFHVVAKLEDLANSSRGHQVLAKMGWNMTLDIKDQRAKERKAACEPSDADKSWLRTLNKLDYELYNSF